MVEEQKESDNSKGEILEESNENEREVPTEEVPADEALTEEVPTEEALTDEVPIEEAKPRMYQPRKY